MKTKQKRVHKNIDGLVEDKFSGCVQPKEKGWYIVGDSKGRPYDMVNWIPGRNEFLFYGSIISGPFTLNEIVRWWKGKTK